MAATVEKKRWWQRARQCAECGIRLDGFRRPFEANSFCSEQCLARDATSGAW